MRSDLRLRFCSFAYSVLFSLLRLSLKKKLIPTTSDYEMPEENFFEINTTSDNPTQSFSKLINYLKDIDKL